MTSTLDRLQGWYLSMCDGDWEHDTGFSIDTLDNPGWSIEIAKRSLPAGFVDPLIWEERSEHDWISIRFQEEQLGVACGPRNLVEGLDRLLRLLDGRGTISGDGLNEGCVPPCSIPLGKGHQGTTLDRLQDWYLSMCDGDWEHEFGISIKTLDKPGWSIQVEKESLPEDFVDPLIWEERSEDDWISIRFQEEQLCVSCGPRNLGEGLDRLLGLLEGGGTIS